MLPLKSIMTRDVISVTAQTPIFEALDLLSKNRISGLPVINEENEVVGILSEKDVLKLLLDKRLDGKKLVGDYMSRDVVSFSEEDSAVDVCKFFMHSYVRRVPIVHDGKLVGIVSRHDIVELILDAKRDISDFRYS